MVECEVQPINDQLVFEFIENITQRHFNAKTAMGLHIVESMDKQVDHPRWVKVLAIGPQVTDVFVGDIVLVKELRWTKKFRITDKDYWITSSPEILVAWDDKESLPA